MNSMSEMPAELAARRGFRIHAIAFVVVIALLGALDWYTAEPYWVHWVALGWGTGLAVHSWLVSTRRNVVHA